MRKSIVGFALTTAIVWACAGSAQAQVGRGLYGPRQFIGAGGPVTVTPGYATYPAYSSAYVYGGTGAAGTSTPNPANYPVYSSSYVAPGAYTLGVVKPYSYYVLPPSVPSRVYVGPGAFPYYGRPYGHPGDRWSWPYLSGPSYGVLSRYYYPPLGF